MVRRPATVIAPDQRIPIVSTINVRRWPPTGSATFPEVEYWKAEETEISTTWREEQLGSRCRHLSVWPLTNGRRYDNQDVPLETNGALRVAFTKGFFFNRHIRPCFSMSEGSDPTEK
jgi:hypothetical protein